VTFGYLVSLHLVRPLLGLLAYIALVFCEEHDNTKTDVMAMTKVILFRYKRYSKHEVQEHQFVATSISDRHAISYLFYVVLRRPPIVDELENVRARRTQILTCQSAGGFGSCSSVILRIEIRQPSFQSFP
jgi:hypothetical protein